MDGLFAQPLMSSLFTLLFAWSLRDHCKTGLKCPFDTDKTKLDV